MILAASSLYYYYRYNELKLKQLTVAAFLFRLSAALFPYLHEWDERYHALVAKNLSHDFLLPKLYPIALLPYNFQAWGANYIWLHKQPFTLWIIACSIKIFGANELSVRAPSILLSTIAVVLTFYIGKWLFNEKIGFVAAIFHCVNGRIIEMTGGASATDHVDLFYLFFIELAAFLCVYSKHKLPSNKNQHSWFAVLIGVVLGICILCKWLPCMFVVLIYAVLHWREKKYVLNLFLLLVAATLVMAPWQIYAALNFSVEYWYEMKYNNRHAFEVLEGHAHGLLFHFDTARIMWNELVYLPLVYLLYLSFVRPSRQILTLTIWIFLPYIFFTMAATKMPAYVLFCGPAIFIIQALFVENLDLKKYKVLKIILTVAFFLFAFRYCIERTKPFDATKEAKLLKMETEKIKKLSSDGKTIVFNDTHFIATMFYTDVIAYETLPTSDEIEYLIKLGYSVLIKNEKNVQQSLRDDKRVKIVE